jgi:hypothetical protein
VKPNKKFRLQYSLQNSFFLILFLSLVFVIGFLAKQFVYVKDMTQANRSVLTKGSIEVVESMKDPYSLQFLHRMMMVAKTLGKVSLIFLLSTRELSQI